MLRCWIHSMNLCFQLFFLTCQRSFIAVDNLYWVCWAGPTSERITEWACVIHGNTLPVTRRTGAGPKTLAQFLLSPCYESNTRFSLWEKSPLGKSLTIASSSGLRFIEISAHPTFSFQKQKGLLTAVCIHTDTCTNWSGGKVGLLMVTLPCHGPGSSRKRH